MIFHEPLYIKIIIFPIDIKIIFSNLIGPPGLTGEQGIAGPIGPSGTPGEKGPRGKRGKRVITK